MGVCVCIVQCIKYSDGGVSEQNFANCFQNIKCIKYSDGGVSEPSVGMGSHIP